MRNVKRIFFITEDEARRIRTETKDPYIYHLVPHYELEDGTIMYGKIGYPADGSLWFEEAGRK